METFLEILKFTLPSVIILVTVIFMMRSFIKQSLEADRQRSMFDYRRHNAPVVVPAKLRAVERLTLFLERVGMESMLGRLDLKGLNVLQLHQLMLQTVRTEFEHNISQQIYVEPETWAAVRNAREFVSQFVNQCALQCNEGDDAMVLAEMLLKTNAQLPDTPVDVALSALRNEVCML